jgi:uncharacterized phage-like protein YoqJ
MKNYMCFAEDSKSWFAEHLLKKPYPSYRAIICHALFNYYKRNGQDVSKTKMVLEKFLSAYKSLKSKPIKSVEKEEFPCLTAPFEEKEFLYLYAVKMGNEDGYLFIDKSDGYIPLLVYPKSKTFAPDGHENLPRKDGMDTAVGKIESQKEKIIERFVEHKGKWNKEFQEKLQVLLEENLS